MNLFELFVKIGVDDQASDKISSLSSKLGSGLATAAKVGTAAVGAASTAIVALGKIGLEYNSQMEQYTTNFATMLGSQEAAVQKVQELKEFAASTPLSMDDLAQGTQTLLAFGVESKNSTKILKQLGDISLGDADKMKRLATAFGKATASGKVTGDTVQQMIDAGWNPLIQISQSAGETMEETQKRMSAGAISVEELQQAGQDSSRAVWKRLAIQRKDLCPHCRTTQKPLSAKYSCRFRMDFLVAFCQVLLKQFPV